ncbi:MPN070 family protein [Mycoplasmoides genitalium]
MKVFKKLHNLNEILLLISIFFLVCIISLVGIGIIFDLIRKASLSAIRSDPIFFNLRAVLIVLGVFAICFMIIQLVISIMIWKTINTACENIEPKFKKTLHWSCFLPFGLLQLYCYQKIKLVKQADNL